MILLIKLQRLLRHLNISSFVIAQKKWKKVGENTVEMCWFLLKLLLQRKISALLETKDSAVFY